MKKNLLLLLALICISCQKNDDQYIGLGDYNENNFSNDQVSVVEAQNVAHEFITNFKTNEDENFVNKNSIGEIKDSIAVKDISQINDKNGMALMHIFNFEEGGFCIISATKQIEPILAFSETGYFDLNEITNVGLTMWLDETTSYISNPSNLTESQIETNRLQWITYDEGTSSKYSSYSSENQQRAQAFNQRLEELSGGSNMVIPLSAAASYLPPARLEHFKSIAAQYRSPEQFTIVEIIDETFSRSVGPLISTNWHQGSPFNELVPNDYAGCTAVAAGQIMYYHKQPSSYNWNNMSSSNILFKDDVQYLMRDLGVSFDMDYKNDGSGANIDDVRNGLHHDYGYEVAKKDHALADVTNSLFNKRQPVYMTGKRTKEWFGLIYKDGHAWVCEGANEYQPNKAFRIEWQVGSNGAYSYDTNGITYKHTAQAKTSHGYMNWGWGSSFNGWFGLGSSEPIPGSDYQYKRTNLYINPN